MTVFLFLLLGLGIGAAVAWVIRGTRPSPHDARVENELREQLRGREAELANLRQELGNTGAARASAETARDSAAKRLTDLQVELDAVREKSANASGLLATAQADLAAQRQVVTSIQETAAEQRRLQEQAAATATRSLQATTEELERVRALLANSDSALAKTAAELKARQMSLIDLTTALTESKDERRKDADKATTAAEQAAESLRTLQTKLTQAVGELANNQAQLRAEQRTASELRTERDGLVAERGRLQEQLIAITNRTGELDSQVKFLNERLATERQQIESIQEKFRKDFEAISNKLLVDNAMKFGQQSAESLDKLLSPLKENLTQFKDSLDKTRTETAGHNAVLKDSIARIGTDAANLAKALKGDVKLLGNWGENMLDQLLEASGLQQGVHYRRQVSSTDVEGDQRFLDVVIDLPEKRNLVIDSKVSLKSFEEAHNAADELLRAELQGRHVDSIRTHFRDLGGKKYHDLYNINAPDFVLMYIPIEAAYFSAISREPRLFAEAFERRVVLITNSTLLATLRTVANVWRLADQQKNAIEIADRGGKLYDKFVGFVEDLGDVGKALDTAQKALGAANTKLHSGSGNLVRQAELMKTLGAKAAKALPPALVEKAGAEVAPPQIEEPKIGAG